VAKLVDPMGLSRGCHQAGATSIDAVQSRPCETPMPDDRSTYDATARLKAIESAVAYLLALAGGQVAEISQLSTEDGTELIGSGLLQATGPVEQETALALNDLLADAMNLAREMDRVVTIEHDR
jgi:hypothetical protein